MESISIKSGKKFTGKFASTAVRLGLATPSGETEKPKPKPKAKVKSKAKKAKK
jgi:hypothetical protein